MKPHRFTLPPSAEDIVAIAEEALNALPRQFLEQIRNTSIQVEDFADDETLRDMRADAP